MRIMREILFRGRRVDDGEWVEGFYGQFHNRPTIKEPNIHQIFVLFTEEKERENEGHIFSAIGGVWHTIIPETIGQYTGSTDKNGKKIFEGDICQHRSYYSDNIVISVVTYTDGQFLAMADENSGFNLSDKLEIIGNIHDNPELLKGGNNNA